MYIGNFFNNIHICTAVVVGGTIIIFTCFHIEKHAVQLQYKSSHYTILLKNKNRYKPVIFKKKK